MKRNSGFTLVEILVALVVVAIGLLGIAAMQVVGLRSNNGASYRSQASAVAADIAERMRANPEGLSPAFDAFNSTAANCLVVPKACSDYYGNGGAGNASLPGTPCTRNEMAAYDLNVMACGTPYGAGRVGGVGVLLPGGRFTVACTNCPPDPPTHATYTVSVFWNELQPAGNNGASALKTQNVIMTVIP